jgi:methylamine utilization protein MauE
VVTDALMKATSPPLMPKERRQRWTSLLALRWTVQMIVGGMLLLSGVTKLNAPSELLTNILAYDLVRGSFATLVTAILPAIEVLVGGCLLVDARTSGALLIAALLGLAYSVAQISVLLRELTIPCGCFGPWDQSFVGAATLVRALCLFILAFAGYILTAFRSDRAAHSDS